MTAFSKEFDLMAFIWALAYQKSHQVQNRLAAGHGQGQLS